MSAVAGQAGGEAGTAAGGGAGAGNLPDLDPNADIADLTEEELRELCDWQVGLFGGYDVTTPCGTSSTTTYTDQDQCVAATKFRCTLTVAQYEACNLSLVPSAGCDRSDPSCKALYCTQ